MKVKIDDIIINAGTQARVCINDETVDTYAERMIEGDEFPAIVVFSDGTDMYLADGFHRVLASERNGFIDIEADVRKGTQLDALWYALGANKSNGQRMSRGDVKHAVELALRTWPDKTQSEIALQVGCVQSFVHKVKEDVITSDNVSLPETRTDSIGRKQPTRKKRKQQEETPDETGETEEDTTAEKPKREKATRPCLGMKYAELAIMDLEKIERSDTERIAGFDSVIEWINKNK
jgi:hypothetical protein